MKLTIEVIKERIKERGLFKRNRKLIVIKSWLGFLSSKFEKQYLVKVSGFPEQKKIEHLKPFGVDLITSRAVADTKTLMKLCSNFKKEDTIMLFYKGENVENEIDESLNYKIIDRGLRRYLIVY